MKSKDKKHILIRLEPNVYEKMEEIRSRREMTRDAYITSRVNKDK